jgi:two-component system sensor histidine kinase and response regulator WspE
VKKHAPEHHPHQHLSMQELFRVEAENQTALLTKELLELERSPASPEQLEALMRAAHSFKGAARIVNLSPAVQVAHAMEDCFVAAQQGRLALQQEHVDVLLRGVDLLNAIAKHDEHSVVAWQTREHHALDGWLLEIRAFTPARVAPEVSPVKLATPKSSGDTAMYRTADITSPQETKPDESDRFLRLTAENLNRLLALAGESLVESRWLRPFAESMQRLKRMQSDLEQTLDSIRQMCDNEKVSEPLRHRFQELHSQATDARHYLDGRLQELDLYDRRAASLSNRLYLEVLRTRMRPFGDGVLRFPRMVRDLARSLGKQVRLEVHGETTQVDRDILDRLEAPLTHLLRNAVDHGCEYPEERARQGKPREAIIRLEARHTAGMLQVVVADDGSGLDTHRVREVIVRRKLTTQPVADKMTETELLQFLFLPGFTLRDTVTEISGRGVGLDVVQNMVRAVRGSVRVSTLRGRGMRFQLQLPITMSVLRTLLVEISGEPYAFPLAQIGNTLQLTRDRIETLEGRHHFRLGDQHVSLLAAHQIFEASEPKPPGEELPVVVLGERNQRYGLLVDRFLGERELVVQPLDPRLGKIKDISAAALMEDGAPVLIVDVDDMIRSIEKLATTGELANVGRGALSAATQKRKRVLVVDDSLTVRELERKLLDSAGYAADVAVDGMDGWNAVRSGNYDLIITDVDMPRMDGIELTTLIKKDENLKALPVMIVSYKDRDEDRMRGLNAGADYYLTKGSFHDETLIQAVVDLIGEAHV